MDDAGGWMMLWIMLLMVVRMMTPPLAPPRPQGGEDLRVVVRADMKSLATIAGGAEGAYILARIMDWCLSNERRSSLKHYKDGQWWMYYSYRQWSQVEVPWLTARQVEGVITSLESAGFVVGKQFRHGAPKWYRPDMQAISVAIKGSSPQNVVSLQREEVSRIRETP